MCRLVDKRCHGFMRLKKQAWIASINIRQSKTNKVLTAGDRCGRKATKPPVQRVLNMKWGYFLRGFHPTIVIENIQLSHNRFHMSGAYYIIITSWPEKVKQSLILQVSVSLFTVNYSFNRDNETELKICVWTELIYWFTTNRKSRDVTFFFLSKSNRQVKVQHSSTTSGEANLQAHNKRIIILNQQKLPAKRRLCNKLKKQSLVEIEGWFQQALYSK